MSRCFPKQTASTEPSAIQSEFYGRVVADDDSITDLGAVVICDNNFFANSDSDRILDGDFRVVGKVISKNDDGVSKFERNKLLKRITPDGKASMTKAIAEMKDLSKYVNVDVDFDFGGKVVKVIPLAVYV